jgi:hypothetical protein
MHEFITRIVNPLLRDQERDDQRLFSELIAINLTG